MNLCSFPCLIRASIYCFNLLLQVVAVGCVMTMVPVETAVLIFRPLIGNSFQLVRKYQSFFIFDLHQHLVDWGSQRGETREFPCEGLRAPVLPPFSGPSLLLPHILPYVFLSFHLLRLFFSSQQCIFCVHVLGCLV